MTTKLRSHRSPLARRRFRLGAVAFLLGIAGILIACTPKAPPDVPHRLPPPPPLRDY